MDLACSEYKKEYKKNHNSEFYIFSCPTSEKEKPKVRK